MIILNNGYLIDDQRPQKPQTPGYQFNEKDFLSCMALDRNAPNFIDGTLDG